MIKKLIRKALRNWEKMSTADKIGGFLFFALIVYMVICLINVNTNNIRLDGSTYQYPWWNFITWFTK